MNSKIQYPSIMNVWICIRVAEVCASPFLFKNTKNEKKRKRKKNISKNKIKI